MHLPYTIILMEGRLKLPKTSEMSERPEDVLKLESAVLRITESGDACRACTAGPCSAAEACKYGRIKKGPDTSDAQRGPHQTSKHMRKTLPFCELSRPTQTLETSQNPSFKRYIPSSKFGGPLYVITSRWL